MDIFEEDSDAVGGEIEAYCPSPKCKADTTHLIISMYEEEVRRVQCEVCGEVHAYRKPRGDSTEESGDGTAKKSSRRRMTWDEAMARATDADLANCRPFSIRDSYEEGDVVHHKTFDVGFVIELLSDNKMEVIFRDGEPRILVHNRGGDLAARMPEISEIPAPRETKKKKRTKKTEHAAPTITQRSKAEVDAAVLRARNAAQARVDEATKSVDHDKKFKTDGKKNAKAPAAAKPAATKSVADKPVVAVTSKSTKANSVKTPVKAAAAAKQAKKPPAPTPAKKPVKSAAPATKKSPAKKPPAKKPPVKKPPAKKPGKKK